MSSTEILLKVLEQLYEIALRTSRAMSRPNKGNQYFMTTTNDWLEIEMPIYDSLMTDYCTSEPLSSVGRLWDNTSVKLSTELADQNKRPQLY